MSDEQTAAEPAVQGPISFGPTDLGPLLGAWRSLVGSDPPYALRVTLDERYVLVLEQPRGWNPQDWPRSYDLLDLTAEPLLPRLTPAEGWRADEIVPGCVHVMRPRRSTLVRSVEPGGTIERAGLQPGDRILSIDGVPVVTEDDVRERFAAWFTEKKALFAKRRDVEITYSREGETHVVSVLPGTVQTASGFAPVIGYETGNEPGDTITPSETAYVAFESLRQLQGGLPLRMYALIVPYDATTA